MGWITNLSLKRLDLDDMNCFSYRSFCSSQCSVSAMALSSFTSLYTKELNSIVEEDFKESCHLSWALKDEGKFQ